VTFSYSVSLNDPGSSAQDTALLNGVQTAVAEWSRYVSGYGSLDIEVNVLPTTRANAAATTVVYLGMDGSRQVYEEGTVNELRTGADANGTAPDLNINVDPTYLETLWLNTSGSSAPPSNKIDGLSVFMHEIGHGLGFLGYRDPATGALAGYETPLDRYVTLNSDGSASFTGAIAQAVYGSAIPVTTLQNGEQYNHLSNIVAEAASSDLMNGVAFYYGHHYRISDLDLAVLKDIGLNIEMVVGDYSATRPVAVPQTASVEAGDTITGTAGAEGTGALAKASDRNVFQLPDVHLSVSAVEGGKIGQAVTGAYGHLILDKDGSYIYAADQTVAIAAGAVGTHVHDVFSHVVSNNYGGNTTSTLDVLLNRAPVAAAGLASEVVGGIAVGSAGTSGTGALSGFIDPDGDALTISAVAGQRANLGNNLAGQYGILNLHGDGSYTYVLDRAIAVSSNDVHDSFAYAVSDGHGATTFANLDLTIPANQSSAPGNGGEEASSGSLFLRVAEDAYQGDVQFIVEVDGRQVGGIQTVRASHSDGGWEDIDLHGNFSDADQISISFINDAYAGPGQDRNFYIDSIRLNGIVHAGSTAALDTTTGTLVGTSAELFGPGTATFNVASDTLVFRVSEDAWTGHADAQFVVKMDGVQVGGVNTVSALHSANQLQEVTLIGHIGSAERIEVAFLNDQYGYAPDKDVNLYIDSVSLNGATHPGSTAMLDPSSGLIAGSAAELTNNGSATFALSDLSHAGMLM